MRPDHAATDDTAGLIGPDDKFITSEHGYRLDTHRPMRCTGPCDQGRKACPCPEACEFEGSHVSGALTWPIYVVLAALAALAVAACWHVAVRLAA